MKRTLKSTKPFLLSIFLCASNFVGSSQEVRIGFEDKDLVKTIEFDKGIKVPFVITTEGDHYPRTSDSIRIAISSNLEELNRFIVKKHFAITQSRILDTLEFQHTKSRLVNLEALLDSINKRKGFFTLEIEPLDKKEFKAKSQSVPVALARKKITVVMKKSSKLEVAQEYNFYLGTNFNFQENTQSDSFYSEIDVFLQNLFWKNSTGDTYGGLRAGVYKNSSSPTQTENARLTTSYSILDNLTTNDSITLQKKRVNRIENISTSNLGFFAQIMVRLVNKQEDRIQFQFFFAPYLEVIQRTQTTRYNDQDLLLLETIPLSTDSDDSRLYQALSLGRDQIHTFYDHYAGAGAPVRYSSQSIEMFMNPVLGFGQSSISQNNRIQSFGLFQFYLMWKKFGFKIHGEIRQIFGNQQEPSVALNLSKRIDIESLFVGSSQK